MTRPEGYRKSLRIARLADKFSLPLLVLLDSPGAHPGNVAEENNQSIAIAENLMRFLDIKTPIVSIVIGEACSGGALALSIADRLAMFDDSMYAVISPESYAKILKRKEVDDLILAQMKYTAYDLKKKNIIDAVLKSKDFDYNSKQVKRYFCESIEELEEVPIKDLLDMRYNKVRYWGWTIK
jgi:acetyl-CoA carboxylase carboxyl transferase subunit alpha